MPISSNSLVHLTNKDGLVGILQSNFKIKYCHEQVKVHEGSLTGAYPMVCFCDIPLSQIKDHLEKYGQYGIGLKKTWGIAKGLNPVLYLETRSNLSKELVNIVQTLFSGKGKKISQLNELDTSVIRMASYIKNYEGDLERGGIVNSDYRFADEKEWRYVPLLDESTPLLITGDRYLKNKERYNEQLADMRLIFHPNDINYIIIQHEEEIREFIDILRNSKRSKYTLDDIERLTTRIITVDRMMEDF